MKEGGRRASNFRAAVVRGCSSAGGALIRGLPLRATKVEKCVWTGAEDQTADFLIELFLPRERIEMTGGAKATGGCAARARWKRLLYEQVASRWIKLGATRLGVRLRLGWIS